MKYSWTKKNFGMDRDVVADSIIRNCKREDCLKSMRMEMARLSTSLCSNAWNPQVPDPEPFPEMGFGMPAALPCLPPCTYRWPFALPVPPMFPPPGDFPIQIPFFASMCDVGNPLVACNQTLGFNNPMVDPRGRVPQPEASGQKSKLDSKGETPVPTEEVSLTVVDGKQTPVKVELEPLRFRKPKNVYEYRSLMEAARRNPSEFPKVLNKEKTRFLSILGIAPKSVCSTRTMRKFRKELRHKLLMNRECMIYRERKALRDKNKLRKFSHEKPKRQFLDVPRRDFSATNLEKPRSDSAESKAKVAKKSFCEQNDGSKKRLKVSDKFEVIDIISSDEESQSGKISKYESCAVSESQNQSNGLSNNLTFESKEKTVDVKNVKMNDSDNAENAKDKTESNDKCKNPKDGESLTVENNENANSGDGNQGEKQQPEESGNKPSLINYQAQNIQNFLNAKPVLLPKVVHHIPILSKPTNPPNVSRETNSIQTPKFLVSGTASRVNVTPKYSTNYLFPSANAGPIVIRPLSPSNAAQQTLVVSDPNSVTRIVYPLPASQANEVKMFLTDKNQKEGLYAPHRYNRPILPQIHPRSESQVAFDPEMSKNVDPMPSITSQLQKLKQMKAERERIRLDKMYNQGKSKIDFNEEMSRIAKWIYGMKANLNPNMFQHGIEKSVHKLISQLDMGIYLVREAKKSLTEIEKSLGTEVPSATTAE